MSALRISEPGFRSTVQDLGRFGHLRSAVPPAGPADPFAFEAAQRLVGNDRSAAGIEIVGLPFRCTLDAPRLVAVTGREVALRMRTRVPGWTAAFARADEEIVIEGSARTRFAYLAVSGGIAVPSMLGSRSSYLPARIGPVPHALRAGDALPVGEPRHGADHAGREVGFEYGASVRVLLGPHADRLADLGAFIGERFRVSEHSDRMGVRLDGPRLATRAGEILSMGVVAGAVQVPGGGEPIVLLADHQTTGGYPVIAAVIQADLGRVAQAAPGEGLSFYLVEREAAVDALREGRARLEATLR